MQLPINGWLPMEDVNGKIGTVCEIMISVESIPSEQFEIEGLRTGKAGYESDAERGSGSSEDEIEVHGYTTRDNKDAATINKAGFKQELFKFKQKLESKIKKMVSTGTMFHHD
jgi:hypothetical protein